MTIKPSLVVFVHWYLLYLTLIFCMVLLVYDDIQSFELLRLCYFLNDG